MFECVSELYDNLKCGETIGKLKAKEGDTNLA